MNVKSVFFLIKECLHLLKKSQGGANILVTSSSEGKYPNSVVGVYAMSKAAVDNMVRWLAQELLEYGIRVNALGPSLTRTPMTAVSIEIFKKAGGFNKNGLAEPE